MKLLIITAIVCTANAACDPATKVCDASPKCVVGVQNNAPAIDTKANATTCTGQWILNHRQGGYPDHHPVPKTWWAKRMANTGTDDTDNHDRLYFGGPVTTRQIKQLYEAGFDSIFHVGSRCNTQPCGKQGLFPLPTWTEVSAVAKDAGLLHVDLGTSWSTSADGLDQMTKWIDFALANTGGPGGNNNNPATGPIYVYDDYECGSGAALALQIYRARKGTIKPNTVKQAAVDAAWHGIVFPPGGLKAIARETKESQDITDEDARKLSPLSAVAEQTAEKSVCAYTWLKWLYNVGEVGIFDAGQIQQYHVKALKDANIKVVINMRGGKLTGESTSTDRPGKYASLPQTQEPVNLLNLAWGKKSKAAGANKEDAKKLVVSADRSKAWACQYPRDITPDKYTPCVSQTELNHETTNSLEWGDEVGQNAKWEGADLEANGITYMHLPVGIFADPVIPFNADTFLMYADKFIAAHKEAKAKGGHVLYHCTIGYRTGSFPTALYGLLAATPGSPTGGVALTREQLDARMGAIGYDVADKQTGHIFEKGTNALFGGTSDLKFEGTVDWKTGDVDGKILKKPTTTTKVAISSLASDTALAFTSVLISVLAFAQ